MKKFKVPAYIEIEMPHDVSKSEALEFARSFDTSICFNLYLDMEEIVHKASSHMYDSSEDCYVNEVLEMLAEEDASMTVVAVASPYTVEDLDP